MEATQYIDQADQYDQIYDPITVKPITYGIDDEDQAMELEREWEED